MVRVVLNSMLKAVSFGSLEFGQHFNASMSLVDTGTDSTVLSPTKSIASGSLARSREVAVCAT